VKNRLKYLDVAKFIGIFCIYLGHFGSAAGNAYDFVFAFHVPLFFFLSGYAENLSANIPLGKYIVKNVKNLLIPCYIFAISSLGLFVIANDTHTAIIPGLLEILKGCIRNHFLAYSLWFLTCLFIVKISFNIFCRLFKSKRLVFLLCSTLYCISELLMTPRPIVSPQIVYNIDSACYYIIYYALGYFGFEFIQSFLDWQKPTKKAICVSIGTALFIYAVLLFFKKDILVYANINAIMLLLTPVLRSVFIILLVLIVSKALENVELFCLLGKNTLFLCGSEYIIKYFVPLCIQTVGLSISYPNPLAVYVYTFLLLVLCNRTLVPLEKAIFMELHLLK